MMYRWAGLIGLLFAPVPAAAMGCFSRSSEPTLRETAADAQVVLYGTIENGPGGTSSLVVCQSLRSHPDVKVKTVIPLNRKFDDPKAMGRVLVVGDLRKGKVEVISGKSSAGTDFVQYLSGALAVNQADRGAVLKYAAGFLEHANPDIADEAVLEFQRSSQSDLRAVGRGLSADRLRGWLRDPKMPAGRLRLYAFLLAQCGTRADARLLREILDRRGPRDDSQIDDILTAYTLLDPAAGRAYTFGLLKDPKSEFMIRYSALRSVRYFRADRPEVFPEADRLAALRLCLDHADMADLAVLDLRKWKCWDLTDEVLGLADRTGFEAAIIRRAVIRYALDCPHPRAAAFIANARLANREEVADQEDWNRLEAEAGKE
jgi:hypothetical protein